MSEQIPDLQQKLQELPPGRLICKRNGNYSKWFLKLNQKLTYLPKSQRALAQELALKEFYSRKLKYILQEKEAFATYLKKAPTQNPSFLNLLEPSSLYRELLSDYFRPRSEVLFQWANAPYETNPLYPEECIHNSCSGNKLRSKSEVLIDTELFLYKIPFRYESALHLGSNTIFPDFTIRHPKTGNFFYWEHFGIMDEPSYSQKTFSKLLLYNSHNIIPTINLITTYETKKHPLDINYVHSLIQQYFL